MTFIDNYALMGKGLGYIDMHLLLAAHMTRVPLWTQDKRLRDVATNLGLAP
jgi:predicted nucleic acid-binding protein